MTEEHYVIATGQKGRDRLRVLTRVFAETTTRLLDGIGIGSLRISVFQTARPSSNM